MRLADRLLLLGVVLAPLLINLDTMFRVTFTLFLALGFISLLSTYLPARYQLLVIPLIYLPAITSLGVLIFERRPQFLIDLASGYLISIPFIAIISLIKSSSPRAAVLGYLASLTSSYFLWSITIESRGYGGQIFLSLIQMFMDRQALERIQPPQHFAALAAFSAIALILYVWRVEGSKLRHENSGPFIYSAVASSLAVALIVLYSLAFTDSVALGMVVAASLTIAAAMKVGVLERWRRT